MLGWALLRPGLLTRRNALAIAAQKAVRLLVEWVEGNNIKPEKKVDLNNASLAEFASRQRRFGGR